LRAFREVIIDGEVLAAFEAFGFGPDRVNDKRRVLSHRVLDDRIPGKQQRIGLDAGHRADLDFYFRDNRGAIVQGSFFGGFNNAQGDGEFMHEAKIVKSEA